MTQEVDKNRIKQLSVLSLLTISLLLPSIPTKREKKTKWSKFETDSEHFGAFDNIDRTWGTELIIRKLGWWLFDVV